MKQHWFIAFLFVVGVVLLLNSGCQGPAKVEGEQKSVTAESGKLVPVEADQNQPKAKIKFEKVVVDFGKVGPGSKSTDKVKFTNAGEGVLKITKVGQCCGVATKLEKDAYAPGESGILEIIYTATAQIGKFNRTLVVHSNDKAESGTKLTIKAEIVEKVACKPDKLRLFLDEENAGCAKLEIRSLDNQPFKITRFISTGNCITADFDPEKEAAEFVLELKADVEKLQNNQKGSIEISLTHPEGKIAYVRFDVLPKFSVSPPILVVFNAEPQKPIIRPVLVFNNYEEDFEIESTSSKENLVKVINQNKIDNGYQLDVEITPPERENRLRFTDVFSINIKGGEQKTITCNGYYLKGK
ncbi:MAG: DUF1573 domain-containing protein [Sedimentisphaerales bacterium]|nr:DUF1573 domain-containing protein [Sedimentisphaerales bacterium]